MVAERGRGGGSQRPAEVLSGSSCVPPDSWHGEEGGVPHQLCTAVPAAAQRLPSCSHPAAGLLNWRFVAAQGSDDKLGGKGSWGRSARQDCRKQQKWQAVEQTESKGCRSLARGGPGDADSPCDQ